MLTKEQAIKVLLKNPLGYAKKLGFDKLNEINAKWILDMVNGEEDRTLEAHRGSYKTTCVSFAIADIAILYPNLRIMFMRKTDSDVKEVIRQVEKILQNPYTVALVKCMYGIDLRLSTRTSNELTTNILNDVKGTSQIVGMGSGTSITGKHFDRIFTDDIINVNDRISRAEREKTKIVYQELQNVKNKNGRIFNTLTPWHKDDASTIMPPAVKYDCYSTGILSEEDIKELKSKMTASLFAANYELKHIASDDVIFSDPQTGFGSELVKNGTSHCDAAFYGEDYTAFTIITIHDGFYYVYGKCWRKHVDDVLDKCVELHNKYLAQKLYIEKNADKGYVAKAFREKGLRVVPYNESQNKYVKITTHLKHEWKNVRFVEGTDEEYIDMICDYNENAEHDDCPDSLASLIRKLPKRETEVEPQKPSIFL